MNFSPEVANSLASSIIGGLVVLLITIIGRHVRDKHRARRESRKGVINDERRHDARMGVYFAKHPDLLSVHTNFLLMDIIRGPVLSAFRLLVLILAAIGGIAILGADASGSFPGFVQFVIVVYVAIVFVIGPVAFYRLSLRVLKVYFRAHRTALFAAVAGEWPDLADAAPDRSDLVTVFEEEFELPDKVLRILKEYESNHA
jgi:hypothetical protein